MERNLKPKVPAPLEVWGGIEGTINRVGDVYFDQCEKNGHRTRPGDLALIKGVGITHLRYPFLWELSDWQWFDQQTKAMLELGIKPIVGLVHHGSGPRDTSLLDPQFPEKLAAYAANFSKRYPWIEDYTPVNEPLTTARFSGLYGVWYPHGKSEVEFLRALFHEIKGTILAMQEIRKVNPKARLIQTDDLGRASGTPKVQYQVDFENERRWLSFDLLCGRVKPGHRLYLYLKKNGLTVEELKWIEDNACPPDVIGINHYLLSSRFLDEELHHYDPEFHGGNGKHEYADVGAVDSPRAKMPSADSIFLEAWERYHLPIAITEVHVQGGRESQLRWFQTIWNAAEKARQQGANIQAVTAWSVLGSYDWNSLCTKNDLFYESGVFDLRAKTPRPTALAKFIQKLSTQARMDHALFEHEGWWVRGSEMNSSGKTRPIVITGGRGTLAQAFARICKERRLSHLILNREQMDIADHGQVSKVLRELKPWAVINAAGYVKVDLAEKEPEKCFRENVEGPEILARICAELNIPLLTFSSDLVFDGRTEAPYVEIDSVCPLNTYGRTKAEGENRVLSLNPNALVIRTSSFFGPWDDANFITQTLKKLNAGESVEAASDIRVTPTYVPDLVNASLDLLIDEESGVFHLTNEGIHSWSDFAKKAADASPDRISSRMIIEKKADEFSFLAPRPRNTALISVRAQILPSVDNALARYFKETHLNRNHNFKEGMH